MSDHSSQQAVPDKGAASPRSILLKVLQAHVLEDHLNGYAQCTCSWTATDGDWWITHPEHVLARLEAAGLTVRAS